MADLAVQVNKDNIKVIDSTPVVFVVVRNQTIYNKKTHKTDDYTNLLRVFISEEKAHEFVIQKTKERGSDKNIQYYCIPTPYGDI